MPGRLSPQNSSNPIPVLGFSLRLCILPSKRLLCSHCNLYAMQFPLCRSLDGATDLVLQSEHMSMGIPPGYSRPCRPIRNGPGRRVCTIRARPSLLCRPHLPWHISKEVRSRSQRLFSHLIGLSYASTVEDRIMGRVPARPLLFPPKRLRRGGSTPAVRCTVPIVRAR